VLLLWGDAWQDLHAQRLRLTPICHELCYIQHYGELILDTW